jgi:hypothetical protein
MRNPAVRRPASPESASPAHCQILAFIDGDGSDDPQDISRLVGPIQSGAHDFIIGSRAVGGYRVIFAAESMGHIYSFQWP